MDLQGDGTVSAHHRLAKGARVSIELEIDDELGVLRLDRPARANAYDEAMLDQFEQALTGFREAEVRVVIVEAAGEGAFCGGADLSGLKRPDPLAALDLRSQRLFEQLARAPWVSIAAVGGPAVAGGCELALACDLRLVGPRARFGLPETSLGLIPSAGGTTRLARLIGGSLARQVILAGREIDAQQAVAWGLALGLHEDPRQEARALAARLVRRDPLAQRLAKELLAGPGVQEALLAERLAEALLYARKGGG